MPDLVSTGKSTLTGGLRRAVSLGGKLSRMAGTDKSSATVTLGFCNTCGAVLSGELEPGDTCPACKHVVEAIAESPPGKTVVASTELDKETLRWIKKDYRVVRQKSDFVELRKPKRFSEKWATAWLIAGIPFPGTAFAYAGGYAVWHVMRKERSVTLFLGQDGAVRTEKKQG